jgi:hypothetical protein
MRSPQVAQIQISKPQLPIVKRQQQTMLIGNQPQPRATIGENRELVTGEPVEFEK